MKIRAENDFRYMRTQIKKLKSKREFYTLSEWATKKRYLPPELSSQPGYWNNDRTPYLVEPMDCLSENSHIRDLVFMKAAQIGATTGIIENFIGYTIDHCPGPMMFVTADQKVAETSVELRIDRMITSAGLADKIFSQGKSNDKFSRKTGDTKEKKEFVNGFLLARGANSPSKLRTFSIRFLLLDEIDAYPLEAGTEGDPVSLAEMRTAGYGATRKHAYISTPLIEHTSKINALYLRGDQRKYMVPCKDCNGFQELTFRRDKDGRGGIIFDRDEDGHLIPNSVGYVCKHCGVIWKNADKINFLVKGKWVATAKSCSHTFRSYQISALYSPIGMLSWSEIVEKWLATKKDTRKLKSFINTVLGQPWQERGDKPDHVTIMKNKKRYKAGTIPPDVLLLTAACDVHKEHIDVEILGWARDQVSYSIKWIELKGPTLSKDAKIWDELRRLILNGVGGHKISMTLVDSGYRTDQVYSFCSQFGNGVYPLKGKAVYDFKTAFKLADAKGYGDLQCLHVTVDFYKDRLAAWLKKTVVDESKPYWGTCLYPEDYPDSYFKQYSNEQKVEERDRKGIIKYVWKKVNESAANHAWDCRIYNIAAFDFLVELYRLEYDREFTIEEFYDFIDPKKRQKADPVE